MRAYQATTTDVFRNLAAEEWLLDAPPPQTPLLFLWQSSSAVVIGKNQNPWLECDTAALAGEGVTLARRISGGGAVYHDGGNLNYALLQPRAEYDRGQVFDRLADALRGLGIPAERMGRSSLGCGGRKFSGTAFCFRGGRALHHGTVLVNADLDRLRRVLQVPARRIRTRAIASEPAPVMNLQEVRPSLTVETLAAALAGAWGQGVVDRSEPWQTDARYGELCRRHTSAAWRWGRTPPFEADHDSPHGGDILRLTVRVEQGVIVSFRWRGVPPAEPAVAAYPERWRGMSYPQFLENPGE